jgi:hypothetical protein
MPPLYSRIGTGRTPDTLAADDEVVVELRRQVVHVDEPALARPGLRPRRWLEASWDREEPCAEEFERLGKGTA